jgi:hypothetical protein
MWSNHFSINQRWIEFSIGHWNWIKSDPLPIIASAGIVVVSRLVGLLLRTMLLLLILLMLLLLVLIMLISPKGKRYVSHLVLVTSRAHSLPLHRGYSFSMGRHDILQKSLHLWSDVLP